MKAKQLQKNKSIFLYCGSCVLLTILLVVSARTADGFAEWYAKSVFPFISNTLGRLLSPLPFSLFETGVVLAFLFLVFGLGKASWLLLKNKSSFRPWVQQRLKGIACIICSLALLFALNASVNYNRMTFAESAGYEFTETSTEALFRLAGILIDDLNQAEPGIDRDPDGLLSLEQTDLHQEAIAAMKKVGERFPLLGGYYPKPKPIFLSKGMSYLGVTGIYSPFTMEANYNRDVAAHVIPFTIAHELSHLKGFMREDEANFIAYLACRSSDSETFQYSGALNALLYTLQALRPQVSAEEYAAVLAKIPEPVWIDIDHNRVYWGQHTVSITALARSANDSYLVANAQMEGIKSYGRMVDLLLMEYKNNKNIGNKWLTHYLN